MHQNHLRIHRFRCVVLGVVRSVALLMLMVGFVMVANRVLFGYIGEGSMSGAWGSWVGIGTWHGVFMGVPLIVGGIGLGLTSRWLAAWIVQAPPPGCANCGYGSLDDQGRCSECGLD